MTDERGAYATIAQTRMYPRLWFVHDLGVDRRRRESRAFLYRAASELHVALTHAMTWACTAEYFGVFYERDLHWNQRVYNRFAALCSRPDDVLLDEYQVFKARTDTELADCAPQPFTVAAATQPELRALSRKLARTTRPLEFAAYSYEARNIALARHGAECSAQGFERARGIFVARDARGPVAALIAEIGEDGLNVFGLLDSCRLVILDERRFAPAAERALLRMAVQHYRAAGKREFLYLADMAADLTALGEAGLTHVSVGNRWLIHRSLVPMWMQYLEDAFGSKESRHAQRERG
jgi:hypothetical protein